ncbi:hypothetical protein BX666DRAFT_1230767 [Dichotomocladium elegans]|nr:hypothetical protein BX666DRAFT_1230767 [Dichotomocladium elegans]
MRVCVPCHRLLLLRVLSTFFSSLCHRLTTWYDQFSSVETRRGNYLATWSHVLKTVLFATAGALNPCLSAPIPGPSNMFALMLNEHTSYTILF